VYAVGIVIATLVVLATILFGTDRLDRRLNGGVSMAETVEADLASHSRPRRARGTGRSTSGATTAPAACRRKASDRPPPVVHGRTAGPHGPLIVPEGRDPAAP
jgi:hypothetical protein